MERRWSYGHDSGRLAIVISVAVHAATFLSLQQLPPAAPAVGSSTEVDLEWSALKVEVQVSSRQSAPPSARTAVPQADAPDVPRSLQAISRTDAPNISAVDDDTGLVDSVSSSQEDLAFNASAALEELTVPERHPGLSPARSRVTGGDAVDRIDVTVHDAAQRGRPRLAGRQAARVRQVGLGTQFGAEGPVSAVSLDSVFGTGRRGALRGELCDIPPSTRRLVDIERCTPVATFYTDDPAAHINHKWARHGRDEWFAVNYTGNFSVSSAGEYKFHLASHDGSMLWIDGGLVIDNDGRHPARSRTGVVNLEAGNHRLRLMHFQGPRTIDRDPVGRGSKDKPVIVIPKIRAGFLRLTISKRGSDPFGFRPRF